MAAFVLGERVQFAMLPSVPCPWGTIRYVGEVHFTFGEVIGIELDKPRTSEGGDKQDGSVDGITRNEEDNNKQHKIQEEQEILENTSKYQGVERKKC